MAYSVLGGEDSIVHSERMEFMKKGGHYLALASGLSVYHACNNSKTAANSYCVVSSMGDHTLKTSKTAQDKHIAQCKKKYVKNIDKSASSECLDKSDLHQRLYIDDGARVIITQWDNRAEILSKSSSIDYTSTFKAIIVDNCP